MALLIALGALALLMFAAYRGHSVILFAPIAAMLAVLLTDPSAVAPAFTGIFMEKMAGFLKLYFPVFALGAIFGKLIEISGYSRVIVRAVIDAVGRERAILSIVLVAAILTYGGVSLFVVVFAVYPFAADMFREANIPKRLIPGTIALGAFTFTMVALPGSPQIQNIIPTTFFKTNAWAAPWLGTIGALVILTAGIVYLEWRRSRAARVGEGYGSGHINEPEVTDDASAQSAWIAILPLLIVGIANKLLSNAIPNWYGATATAVLNSEAKPVTADVAALTGIWAVEGALLLGIACVFALAWRRIVPVFAKGTTTAIGGAMLAATNTASEYGFGAVIASLPGFLLMRDGLAAIPDPLINEAVTVNLLAGITGSASGGMSIALAAMSDTFIAAANNAGIPLEVFHRIAAMASGGLDSLPHNGAVITLLAVTGLTHRQSYIDIFAVTCISTVTVFLMIALYYATGIV